MFDYIESFNNRSKASLAGGLLELLRLWASYKRGGCGGVRHTAAVTEVSLCLTRWWREFAYTPRPAGLTG